MDHPLISIIITTYNYCEMLPLALESACGQDYPNFEVLVLDNASTDGTERLMGEFSNDARIRYIRNDSNIGMVANHNKGFALSRGEYIVYLSADDMLMPDHLSKNYLYLQTHPDIDVVYTPLYVMNEHGRLAARRESELPIAYNGGRNEFACMLAFGCDMCLPTMLVPRRLYEKYGLFDDAFISWDYDIYLRWSAAGVTFGYTTEPLAGFRAHVQQQTSVPNYTSNGKLVHEYVQMIHRYVTPQNAKLLRGYEESIIRLAHSKYCAALRAGYEDNENLIEQVESACEQVRSVININRSQPFMPELAIIVIAGDDIFQIEASLRSLARQSQPHWRALVIQQPNMSLDGLCKRVDPAGRIQAYTLTSTLNEGESVNAAMAITKANSFAFMRAGTIFPPDHIARIHSALQDPECDFTLARTVLLVGDGMGNVEAHQNVFTNTHPVNALGIPAFPLDAIALKRHTVDRYLYMNEHIQYFIEWDLAMRLIPNFTYRKIDSDVSVYLQTGKANPWSDIAYIRNLAITLYDYFAINNPEIQTLRQRYLEQLAQLITSVKDTTEDFGTIIDVLRSVTGTELLTQTCQFTLAAG
jgi:glycosyltransferase involved in cell wall biosynthesis